MMNLTYYLSYNYYNDLYHLLVLYHSYYLNKKDVIFNHNNNHLD